jgi:predicted MPP superfamily phosphohydrolase
MIASEKIALILFLLLAGAPYVLEIVLLVRYMNNKFKSKNAAKILVSTPALAVHIIAAAGIICFLYALLIEPYRLQVKNITIETEKISSAEIRVVHISDLHCEEKIRNEKKLVEEINALRPDVIVFTGDSLNTPDALASFKKTMGDLKAGIGKFAVRGNFDVWNWRDMDLFGGTGFELLDEDTVKLEKNGESFYISGLSCRNPSDVKNLLADVPGDCFSIFLYHYPDLIEDLNNLNVDLYLCGHTHGGQVALPFYGAIITFSKYGKKYESGMYKVGKTILYVNRGIGMEKSPAPKVRFFARPEITVIDIKPKTE